jgi:hypothetical protein
VAKYGPVKSLCESVVAGRAYGLSGLVVLVGIRAIVFLFGRKRPTQTSGAEAVETTSGSTVLVTLITIMAIRTTRTCHPTPHCGIRK